MQRWTNKAAANTKCYRRMEHRDFCRVSLRCIFSHWLSWTNGVDICVYGYVHAIYFAKPNLHTLTHTYSGAPNGKREKYRINWFSTTQTSRMFHCCNDQIAVWINFTWIQSLFCECHKRRMMTFDSGCQVNIGFLLPVKIPGQELLLEMHLAIGNIWLRNKSVARICRLRFCSWITFKMRFYTSILYPLRNVFAIRLSWLTGWFVGCVWRFVHRDICHIFI